MLNAIQGGKFMLIDLHGLKHYAHFYTSIEALCSLLYIV